MSLPSQGPRVIYVYTDVYPGLPIPTTITLRASTSKGKNDNKRPK